MTIELALMLLPGLVIGITAHEAAHALSAKWLGDKNAERMGRISLNPFKHLTLFGTAALFLLGFGWGRPVEINLYNFKRPKLYYLLSSIAGPVSNLLICAVSLGAVYISYRIYPHWLIFGFFSTVFIINAMLATINLLPIPPLDGSKIWPCLIPGLRPTVSARWTRIWMVVLLIAVFTRAIDTVIGPVLNFFWNLLPVPESDAEQVARLCLDGLRLCC